MRIAATIASAMPLAYSQASNKEAIVAKAGTPTPQTELQGRLMSQANVLGQVGIAVVRFLH